MAKSLAQRVLAERAKREKAERDAAEKARGGITAAQERRAISKEERDERLLKYRVYKLTSLANCAVLIEGYDEPTIQLWFDRDSKQFLGSPDDGVMFFPNFPHRPT